MKFKNLSDWIMVGHCATRIKKYGEVDNISDRVAFIEKTPRVRIQYFSVVVGKYASGDERCECPDSNSGWLEGDKGTSKYGLDQKSRDWCDQMLVLLGWETE